MKTLKISVRILIVILAIITLGLLALQNLASIIAIASGIMLVYYIILAIVIQLQSKRTFNYALTIILGIFLLLPIILLLIDYETLLNFLMSGIHLDMR